MSEINSTNSGFDLESRIAAQNRNAASTSSGSTGASDAAASNNGATFAQTLNAANQGITISGHAQTRLASRQINLTAGDFAKLSGAMQKAAAKGAKSSLVLMDRPNQAQIGLVVSIPNRTVITAVDTQSLKENIFTNIDSAMII